MFQRFKEWLRSGHKPRHDFDDDLFAASHVVARLLKQYPPEVESPLASALPDFFAAIERKLSEHRRIIMWPQEVKSPCP